MMTRASATLRRATESDRGPVEHLLKESSLPTAGVAEWLDHFTIAEYDGKVVGVSGVERYGDVALLRSVAVDPSWRASGIGRALVESALATARAQGTRSVYLLTTTAERYFPRFGFERIPRDQVPEALRDSVEFREACPASAAVMRKAMATG
jgi:N-acetylglutamate synthase-like GNAT family acetyltransferase